MTTSVTLDDLVLTGKDLFGCRWRIYDPIDGWDGAPATTITTTQKARQHGAWLGPTPKYVPRIVNLAGLVKAPDSDALEAAIDRLNTAAAIEGARLEIGRGATPRYSTVYADGEVLAPWTTDTVAEFSVPLIAPDPRKYVQTEPLSTGLPTSSGGASWPLAWPRRWTGVSASGTLHIDHPGNIESPLKLRIDGPCAGPRLRHVASGVELVLSSDFTLGAGSWLEIDMETREVLEGGTASRNGFLNSRGFFSLDPGPNDIIFGADSYEPGALLTATFAYAYK